MKKFILLTSVLLTAPLSAGNVSAQCVATQDCKTLGYTETSCESGGVKCPFGNYWACPSSSSSKGVLGKCTGYAKNCQIGWLLNSDGTCTANKTTGKTPIGVIVYISLRGCGQALTATPVATGLPWAIEDATYGSNSITVGSFADRGNYQDFFNHYDGYEDTLKIISKGDSNTFPAAWATVNYAPSEAPNTKGKWFLPAVGTLENVNLNLSAVNEGIKKMNGTEIKDVSPIWSSSEQTTSSVWVLTNAFYTKNGIYNFRKERTDVETRAAIEF